MASSKGTSPTKTSSDADIIRSLKQARGTIQSPPGQKLWRSADAPTGCNAVLRLIRDSSRSDELHEECWRTVTASVQLTSEQKEDPTCDWTDFIIEKGVLVDISREFDRQAEKESEDVLVDALACLTSLCLLQRHVPKIVASGVIPKLLEVGEECVPDDAAVFSLISLSNLAIHKESHDALIAACVLEVTDRLLELLASEDENEMDCGLTAAFVICRLAGHDGPGLDLIKSNPKVIETLSWVLNEVIRVGPKGTVLGSYWDPANIVLDISILSSSPQLRPLMKDFVSLVATALEKRGKGNTRLVNFSVLSLSQLFEEPYLCEAFYTIKDTLLPTLEKVSRFNVSPAILEKANKLMGQLKGMGPTAKKSVNPAVNNILAQSIPNGHTAFSWSGTPEQTYCGLGHTRFSWGA